jgi:hypothetical protein
MTLTRSFNKDNQTRLITPSSSKANAANVTTPCTGCVLQAYNPITTFYDADDDTNPWTSVVVTETILTEFITYLDGTTIDTIVTERKTVNQTKTVVITDDDQTITHSTPVFWIQPTPGVTLTVDAGPTYVIYQNLWGGLDQTVSTYFSFIQETYITCAAAPTSLKNWAPARTEDWSYFIQTHTQELPKASVTNVPIPLPSQIVQYLQGNLAIRSQFQGSNIATCTTRPSNGIIGTKPPSTMPLGTLKPQPTPEAPEYPGSQTKTDATQPVFTTAPPPPVFSRTTGTFLSTTYASTVTHVTRQGCLRCQDTYKPQPTPGDPRVSNNDINAPQPTPDPNILQPPDKPNDPSKPDDRPNDQRPPVITIGDNTYTVRPIQPTPAPDRPAEQNQPPPVVVIGTQTLTQGQSTNINGVPVVIPTDGGGTRIVVGGTTVAVNNYPTVAPVLTVGQNTITANPQGQFVVGSQTLQPGGPAITVDGSTLSLGPSGTIAIVNGVTQTLANVPIVTGAPAITVGGRVVSATVVGGTSQFVLGDKTLAPGGVITVDGTTYSMPLDGRGTAIVVNGVTSTLQPGQSALTLGKQGISATVKDGTTAYVFGPDQTLTPGGVVTISGTTFSMPASASGSVVVINGVASTIGKGPVTAAALTINGKTYTPNVRDGTTEYVLAPGTTLRPGEAITISGTTYSLDKQGTALVVNGQTSTIPKIPASNSASTTSSARSSTSARDVGNFIWSGLGGGGGGSSSSRGGGASVHLGGLDKWVESLVVGLAGWTLALL